ncbi:MAG: hypothetical protein ACREX9_06115, partial [Gammaproteobacteria bacterium]
GWAVYRKRSGKSACHHLLSVSAWTDHLMLHTHSALSKPKSKKAPHLIQRSLDLHQPRPFSGASTNPYLQEHPSAGAILSLV